MQSVILKLLRKSEVCDASSITVPIFSHSDNFILVSFKYMSTKLQAEPWTPTRIGDSAKFTRHGSYLGLGLQYRLHYILHDDSTMNKSLYFWLVAGLFESHIKAVTLMINERIV